MSDLEDLEDAFSHSGRVLYALHTRRRGNLRSHLNPCAYKFPDGSRCKRGAANDSRYCAQHAVPTFDEYAP